MHEDILIRQAELCKLLANPKRIKILHALRDGERSVTDLQHETGLNHSTVSRSLSGFRTVGIVRRRASGANAYYTLVDRRIVEACDLIQAVLASHLAEEITLASEMGDVMPAGGAAQEGDDDGRAVQTPE